VQPHWQTILGLGWFDHFHFRFGFDQFFAKNRGLGFPRFGFRTLTATFTSRLQPPSAMCKLRGLILDNAGLGNEDQVLGLGF